ncbi:major facilitator superfamily domain-containing protein [Neocallimastix lanati (nom. inval.)]|jgi:EmrB/QacA subfamily drug resistance transporter|nr:major facilitator superfamily domain-containing protein [Neocallimastix sp. JGI-2020a]
MGDKDDNSDDNKYSKLENEDDDAWIDIANIPLSKKNFTLVFSALVICLAMSSLDSSIVSTALPTISKDFNTDDYTWVLTAYFLGDMAFEPMFGKFADIFGRKQVLLFVLGIFIFSSALCGAAQNIDQLIIFRGFQGIGGGGFFSMVIVIIADIVPLSKRGIYMGITSAVSTCASVTGPLVGGLLTDYLSWRWAFFINFPLCAIAAVIIYIYLDIPVVKVSLKQKIGKIDSIGTFLLIGTIVSLLLTLSWGGVDFPWISMEIGILSLSFILFFSAFLFIESNIAKDPIIPLNMFKNRNVIVTCIINFLFGMAAMTVNNTLPLLFRNGKDISATLSGLMLAPQSITSSLGNILVGYLIGKIGYIQRYMMLGNCIVILGNYLLTTIGKDTSIAFILFVVILLGLKLGLNTHSCVLITQQCVKKRFISVGSTVMTFFHLIGGILGIALYGICVNTKFKNSYLNDYANYPNPDDITTNNLNILENGKDYYIKAVQFAYRSIPLPASIATLFAIFLLKDIPVIGSRIGKKSKKIMDAKRKSQINNKNIISKTNVIDDQQVGITPGTIDQNIVIESNMNSDFNNHRISRMSYKMSNRMSRMSRMSNRMSNRMSRISTINSRGNRMSHRISYMFTQINEPSMDLGFTIEDDDEDTDEDEIEIALF